MITDDEARELRAKAMEQDDRLTGFGHGLWDEENLSLEKRERKLQEDREEFLLDKYLDQIRWCAEWIRKQPQAKSINYRSTSYGYKHEVEDWSKRINQYLYVSNGAFIAAALGMSVRGKRCTSTPNYYFAFASSERAREKHLL